VGHRGRDHMVIGFQTTYAISAYHHWCCEFVSRSGRGLQHYQIKFVSDLRHVCGFPPGPLVSSTNKTSCHDITEILLKVALNTINQTKPNHCCSTPNDYFFKLYPDENKFHSMGPCPLCTKTTPGCQVILYSYIFNILLYFLYLPKISYISSQNPIFFKTKREKSWIFYFEWKFHINMTNRCYTRY
jgi:hypothetical protein